MYNNSLQCKINDWVILNKVVLHIVSETVKAVCKFCLLHFAGFAFKVLGNLFFRRAAVELGQQIRHSRAYHI